MKSKIKHVVVVSLFTFLVGCQSTENKAETNTNLISITSKNLNQITVKQWTLNKLIIDGTEHQLTETIPTISINKEGKVTGSASINIYRGKIKIDDQGNIKWSPLAMTRMAGPEELMKQESVFLKALPQTTQLSVDENILYLQGGDKQVELQFYASGK